MKIRYLYSKEFLLHLLLAILICAKGINNLLFHGDSQLVYLVAASILAMLFLLRFKSIRLITSSQIFTLSYLLFFFFIQFVRLYDVHALSTVRQYLMFFLSFGVAPLFIANYHVKIKKLLSCIIIISFILSPFVFGADFSGGDMRDYQVWMGVTYNLLPFVVASIFYLFWGDDKLLRVVAILVILFYLPILLSHAARGGIVALILTPVICMLLKEKYNKGKISNGVIFLVIISFLFTLFYDSIMSLLADVYVNSNYSFLNKMFSLDDTSDGRFDIYKDALDGFIQHPLFGNGIASFWDYSMWPHNIFLQMMYENGIMVIIPFLFILYQGFILIKSIKVNLDLSLYLAFLFINSMIELQFSSYYWKKQAFWLFVWTILYYIQKRKYKKSLCQ